MWGLMLICVEYIGLIEKNKGHDKWEIKPEYRRQTKDRNVDKSEEMD